jgi:hypothetical protein
MMRRGSVVSIFKGRFTHSMPRPCRSPAMPWPWENYMVRAWHGHGMASVNQTRPHCVNQMGKTHSKALAARHGHGMLCVNLP